MAANPLTSTFDIKTIFKGDVTSKAAEKDNIVIDSMWIQSRFMVADSDLDDDVVSIRYSSLGSLKFTNTSIGGNIFINPKPQFNPLTDPKADSVYNNYSKPTYDPGSSGSSGINNRTGMGEGYSRLIDDNQQVVFLEFGLPKFNSLIDFFFRAVDYSDSVLANTGRPSTFHTLGKVAGIALGLVAFPILSVTVYLAKFALDAVIGSGSLKFYYFNAQMPMYWSTVNTIVTQLVTEQGLLTPVFMPKNSSDATTTIGLPAQLTQSDIDAFNNIVPGIISSNTHYVDVFSIVTRAQRAALLQRDVVYKKYKEGTLPKDGNLKKTDLVADGVLGAIGRLVSFGTYLKKVNSDIADHKLPAGDADPVGPPAPPVKTTAKDAAKKFQKDSITGNYTINKNEDLDGVLNHAKTVFDSGLRQGGAYATFAVDYTGSTSESFSNSVTSINIGDQAKQIASKSRALSYDLARGNVFGDTMVQDIANAVGDMARGVLDGVSLGLSNVISSLTGNAYIEIPKRWDDSSMSFQQHTYSMQLIAPYNSFLSQLQNIYVPLCMLLAGVLPLATGKSSYTSPYLCKLFSRSIENVQLGMITSVNITRGTSNLGFDKKRNPLAIDVTFTVTDFSTLVTSPVTSSIFGDTAQLAMEDDTPLGNYISVLGGRDILTSKYAVKRLAMRSSRKAMNFEKIINPDRIGFFAGDMLASTLGVLVSSRALPEIYK